MNSDPVVRAMPVVLVVATDDDASARWKERFEHAGYQVVLCSSPAQALATFSSAVDLVLAPVLVAGVDEDGAWLTRQLKDRVGEYEFLPVILLGDGDAATRAYEAGCDELLPQTVSFFELDARVRSLLTHRWHYAALAEANRRLREAQDKKKALAALVVHDLRNPLSALQGNLDLLYDDLAANTSVVGILADSQELCRKALSMVAGILDVEELEAGLLTPAPSPVAVPEFLRRVSRHHRVPIEVRRLELVFDVDDELEVDIDSELMARVVENLLDNAVRYAPVGGRVVVQASREDGMATLRVGNNGPPVPSDDREKIFERFYRIEARRAGARANRGLGLYFCRLVAQSHGGTIEVESLPELPACFTVRIPQPIPFAAE